ncbi:hypothetical protein SH580_05915 [Coraliomargarita algicola]|uniref:PEP-CTERM protein-sorting domain-containing protein n=1 Tax=Coraliomargarita algicola TaxID=3092156 RepID=A0ABZ0RNZ3_9BACT|nr:hypothetical protein [Coraliomargarita sp. J2-16]WPJ97242.1 hypothetical protein SH580_05915 [Coraliomargarita sp. J2-16]
MNTKINSDLLNRRGLSAFAAILSLGVLASGASASVVVADYDFSGGSAASGDTDSFTTAGDYIGTVSPNTSTYSGISSGSNNAFFFSFQTEGSLSNAITANDYHSFTLDVETGGATVSLDSLEFDQAFWNTHPTLTFSVSVLSSFDGFATAGDLLGTYTIDGADYDSGSGSDLDVSTTVAQFIDLSGITEFQELSSDVEFRFYFYDTSSATDRTHRIDNVVLTASSVIPEPSSFALVLAFASMGASVFLKRGSRNA